MQFVLKKKKKKKKKMERERERSRKIEIKKGFDVLLQIPSTVHFFSCMAVWEKGWER